MTAVSDNNPLVVCVICKCYPMMYSPVCTLHVVLCTFLCLYIEDTVHIHSLSYDSGLISHREITSGGSYWACLWDGALGEGGCCRVTVCVCVCVCVCVRAHCMHLCLGNNCLYNPARYLISAPLQLITWHRRRGGQALKQQLAKCECTTSWCSTTEALGAADSAEVYGAAVTFNSLFTLTKYPTPEIQSSPEHNKSKR